MTTKSTGEPAAIKKLVVLLRTSAGGNNKGRPAWFTKALCIRSLVHSLESVPGHVAETELHVFADGGLGADAVALAPRFTSTINYRGGSSRASMLKLYDAATRLPDREDVLVWFAEDDYLYAPEAFTQLVQAANQITADYFALHAPDDTGWHERHPSQPLRRVAPRSGRAGPEGEPWRRISHTNSTFGGRSRTIRRDMRLLRFFTWCGGPYDHATHAGIQGVKPYRLRYVLKDTHVRRDPRSWVNAMARVIMRITANAVVDRGPGRRPRTLMAPAVDKICHAEVGFVPRNGRWAELADEFAATSR